MLKEINKDLVRIDGINEIRDEWTLITAKKDSQAVNTLTASWGAVGNLWNKSIYIAFVRPERYTHEFLEADEYFSVCFFDNSYKKVLGYLGTTSGRDEDKIKKAKLTINNLDLAPYFEEANKVLIVKKIYVDDFHQDNFLDNGILNGVYLKNKAKFHTIYIGEIIKVFIEE